MKAAFYTLGCKVNQYETQALEQIMRQRGHEIIVFDNNNNADAYIINTCSVTAVSDAKSRKIIRRIRREHPEAVLAVCGCFPQAHPDEMKNLDADIISGTGDRTGFIDLLEQAVKNKNNINNKNNIKLDNARERGDFEILPAGRLSNRTRAMLKIEDGCNNFCSYCVIPYVRGPIRSAPKELVVQQARELREAGVLEIVITGIEISSWGRDLKTGESLIDLTEAICQAVPDVRIRLGSLEPRTITRIFCERAVKLKNLCPQFHLSLQSGCDEILKRMNRKYDTSRYLESVRLLNQYFDRPAITTDLITGFPGETELNFIETLGFLKKCGFARVHVFPYSERPGTPAASMEQIEKSIREERARRAMELAAELQAIYLNGCVNFIYPVLIERVRDGYCTGHAPNYTEIRVNILNNNNINRNQIRPVRVISSDGNILHGEFVK